MSNDNTTDPKFDPVQNPEHYATHQPEHIDIVRDWGLASDCYMQSIVKYLARYRYKGEAIQDLEKALWWAKARLEDTNYPNGMQSLPQYTPMQICEGWEECPIVHKLLLHIFRWMHSYDNSYIEELIIDLKTYISQYKLLQSPELREALKDVKSNPTRE